jgi:hypothetical protein
VPAPAGWRSCVWRGQCGSRMRVRHDGGR